MTTNSSRREAVLDIANALLDIGADDEDTLLDALYDLQQALPGLKPDDLRGWRFRVLVEELEYQRAVEDQDTERPARQSWTDMAIDAGKRVDAALDALIGATGDRAHDHFLARLRRRGGRRRLVAPERGPQRLAAGRCQQRYVRDPVRFLR